MEISPAEILNLVIARYNSCHTYRDTGIAVSGSLTVRFSTLFVRPDKFRLNWTNSSNKEFAVRSNGRASEVFFRNEWKECESLPYALKIAGGASMGVSSFIGGMLLDSPKSSKLLELSPYACEDLRDSNSTTVTITSNPEHSSLKEILCIEITESKIVHRESILSGIGKTVSYVSSQLREFSPDMAVEIENALSATSNPPTPESKLSTKTRFDTVAFNDLDDSDHFWE